MNDALSDHPALVLLEGEAGVGKSRLVRECLDSVSQRGQRVLVAVCPPLSEPFPLGPVVDGLRRVRERIGDLELSPLAGALRPLFPEWTADLPAALEPLEDPAAMRHRLFRALTELVERLGVQVLVLEDAHWADKATLEWLLMLTAAGADQLSVVVTFRSNDVPAESLLLRLTSRRPLGRALVRVTLRPLDAEQTGRLVASMFGTVAVSEEFARFLHQRSEGLPLAIEESVLLLRDRHDVVRLGGEWARRAVDELEVPPSLRDVVQERIERLDSRTRAVLDAAAVLAEPADEALLSEVTGLDGPEVKEGMAAALASGLLHEVYPGRFAFRHAFHAKAVEEAIPGPQRRQLDHRAAQALQRWQHPPVMRLYRHCRGAGDVVGWRRYAQAAARLALESGDHYTAVTILHALLTGAKHPTHQRARLARLLGEAAVHRPAPLAGLETVVRDALRDILADDDLPRRERGEIQLLLGWLLFQLTDFESGRVAFEAAVADLGDRPASAARAMLFLAMPESSGSTWPVDRHLAWLNRATALLPRIEPPSQRQALLIDRASALLALGEESGWQAVAEIPRSTRTPTERRQLARGLLNIADVAAMWGRVSATRQALTEAADIVRGVETARITTWAGLYAALLDWYAGTWDGLEERLDRLVTEEPLVSLVTRTIKGCLDLVRGDHESAERRLRDVLREMARRGVVDPTVNTLACSALARLHMAAGAAEEAVQVIEPTMSIVQKTKTWLWATNIAPVYVHALVRVGGLERATGLIEEFAAWSRGRDAPAAQAAVLSCYAIADEAHGDMRAATSRFAEAATAWAAVPRPYYELLAMERRGCCLLAAGDQEQGLRLLRETQQRQRAMGARWDADRVAHLLRQQGFEVTHAWRGGRRGYGDDLSPRERQVVRLVARGLTNRQIAESLFLSHRTVDRHLSAAMRKLGASSRTAVAMAAADAGLLSPPPNDSAT